MNIYIDESGSINNKPTNYSPYFIVSLVNVKDGKKLKNAYKRFVSSNMERLKELDEEFALKHFDDPKAANGKMFDGDKFKELKGAVFDYNMKKKFIDYFSQKPHFEVFYICLNNPKLTDDFCSNTARCFNYVLRITLQYLICNKYLPDGECYLRLDERNERTDTKGFLEYYLNTELTLEDKYKGPFHVSYYDSSNSKMIQIADVFSNLLYSQYLSKNFTNEFEEMKQKGIVKFIFEFPKY